MTDGKKTAISNLKYSKKTNYCSANDLNNIATKLNECISEINKIPAKLSDFPDFPDYHPGTPGEPGDSTDGLTEADLKYIDLGIFKNNVYHYIKHDELVTVSTYINNTYAKNITLDEYYNELINADENINSNIANVSGILSSAINDLIDDYLPITGRNITW